MTQTPFQALVAKNNRELEQAQAKHSLMSAVLAALVPSVRAPDDIYDFGYCADVSLKFAFGEDALPDLLAAYPPEDLVLVRDGSLAQKPLAYLRDNERSAVVLPLGPLVFKAPKSGEPELLWWTKLASGHMAQVQLRNATMQAFQSVVSGPKYSLDSHSYSTGSTTYGMRSLAPAQTAKSALQAWYDEWDHYAKANAMTGGQLQFLRALRSLTLQPNGRAWANEGLPEPFGPIWPGAAVAIPADRELPEYLEEAQAKARARPEHWMDHVGDFWRYFSRDEADAFWAFCVRKHSEWPQVKLRDEEQAELVARAFEELLVEGYPASDDHVTWTRLNHAVQHRTGLAPILRVAVLDRYTGRMHLDIRFATIGQLADHRLVVQAGKAQPLRPQDVPVIYVD